MASITVSIPDPSATAEQVPLPEKRKRVLHFSDGIEELSDSDDCDGGAEEQCSQESMNESQMEWGPWLALKSRQTGESILSGCDYVGEFLASALGITSPKFIDGEEELRKAAAEKQERDAESAEEIREMDTWGVDTQSTNTATTEPLSTSPVNLILDESERPIIPIS